MGHKYLKYRHVQALVQALSGAAAQGPDEVLVAFAQMSKVSPSSLQSYS